MKQQVREELKLIEQYKGRLPYDYHHASCDHDYLDAIQQEVTTLLDIKYNLLDINKDVYDEEKDEFYPKNTDKAYLSRIASAVNENFEGVRILEYKELSSIVLLVKSRNMNYVMKGVFQSEDIPEMIHEYFVGLVIQQLRQVVPNFSYVLSLYNCVKPLDLINNKLTKNVCTTNMTFPLALPYIVYEYVEGPSFSQHIKKATVEQYFSYIFQILLALKYAQEIIDFTHYDLHTNNIICRKLNKPKYVAYPYNNKTVYIKTDCIPTFIDYGFSHVKYKGKNYVHRDKYFNELGIINKPRPFYDIYKLLAGLAYENLYSSNKDLSKTMKEVLLYFGKSTQIQDLEDQVEEYFALDKVFGPELKRLEPKWSIPDFIDFCTSTYKEAKDIIIYDKPKNIDLYHCDYKSYNSLKQASPKRNENNNTTIKMASQYTKTGLVDIARKNKVKGYSTKNKDELYKILVEGGYLGSARPTKKTSPKGRGRKAYSPKGKKKASPKRKSRSPRKTSGMMKDYTVSELRDMLGCGGTKKALYDRAVEQGLIMPKRSRSSSPRRKTSAKRGTKNKVNSMEELSEMYRNGHITKKEVEKMIKDKWNTRGFRIKDYDGLYKYFSNHEDNIIFRGTTGVIYYDLDNDEVFTCSDDIENLSGEFPLYSCSSSEGKEMQKRYKQKNSSVIKVWEFTQEQMEIFRK